MRDVPVLALLVGFVVATGSGCVKLAPIAPSAPSLFPEHAALVQFDFERDSLSQIPEGFETRSGRWAVVDSPTSLSGTQVLVRRGDETGVIAVKDSEAARIGAGEVGVRVILGTSGAGLGCDETKGGPSYVVKLEPNSGRVALYKKSGDSLAVAAEAPVARAKGEWARLGISCDESQVVGWVDGKPVLRDHASVGSFELALVADPGVTAQFDDLKYWAKK